MKFEYVTDDEFNEGEANLFEHLLGVLKESDAGQVVVIPRDGEDQPRAIMSIHRLSIQGFRCQPYVCQVIRLFNEDNESEVVCVTAEYKEWV